MIYHVCWIMPTSFLSLVHAVLRKDSLGTARSLLTRNAVPLYTYCILSGSKVSKWYSDRLRAGWLGLDSQ
jgi:hypothetical protein